LRFRLPRGDWCLKGGSAGGKDGAGFSFLIVYGVYCLCNNAICCAFVMIDSKFT
jgi:hypothetical protein